MREILFRGKRVDNGEWIEGYFLPGNERQSLHPCIFVYLPETQSFECFDIDIDTLGEYTGVKDKNGTRIFEGDIIKVLLSGNPQPIGVVKYGVTGICGFCVMTERGYSNYVLDKSEYFEVIGNIHDNPELLKGERK